MYVVQARRRTHPCEVECKHVEHDHGHDGRVLVVGPVLFDTNRADNDIGRGHENTGRDEQRSSTDSVHEEQRDNDT